MSYIIYKITNKINNKIYIGQTTRPLQRRKSQYKWCALNYANGKYTISTVIIPAMVKYGFDNFEFENIFTCETLDELNQSEIDFIKKFDCIVPNGYNIEPGGKNSYMPDSVKKKIREAQLGEKNHRFGKFNSQKQKDAVRASNSGRKHTDEAKRKLVEFLAGKPRSEETKRKISKTLKGRPNLKVRKLSDDNEKEIYYKYTAGNVSQKDLANAYSVGETTIGRIIKKYKLSLS